MKSNTKTFVATLNTHLVTDFIAHQAKEKPQSTALQFDQQHLTYQALNNSTNQLAHYLQDIGVQKGTMVAISVERSLEMMIGILGILKAGGVYVPIDPSYPDERIQYILQDTQANLLLTHQHLKSKFAEEVQQVIAFETDWLNILNYPTTTPFVELQKDDLAYIIYTSGSTGKPKGVMVTHENLWYSTTARLQYYTHKVRSFLLLSSFAFDSSVAGIFWTLADGGILVLPPQNAEKDPQHLANLIEKHQISHLLCLPSLHGLLLDYAPSKLASLQTVIVAGEACPKSLVSKHYQRFPNINLYNEYGPTEGSVWATVYHCSKTNIEAQTVPIGKGIAHANIYILDENREPVGIGEQGEIYIGGKGIAKGYLNRPDLTDQKFLEIQVPNQKSVRIYRTGDLGVWLSDGNIEFLGRTDHQIKLRGYRIELGEIEEAIYQLTDIQEAAVVVKGNAIDSRKLVAYATLQLQLQPNHTLTETDIKTHLNHHLPNYMIPTHVVFLKEMPRTPNGKINRKALSELPFSNVAHTSKPNHLLQNNELEGFMLQLWCKILEVENVGMKDKFFELGGNSLQAALFINELQKELQESIFIVTIFDNPTIAEYAAMLRRDYAEALERHPIFKTQIQNSSSNENENENENSIENNKPQHINTPTQKNTTLSTHDFNNFHQYIPTASNLSIQSQTTANQPIIFILAPPRSGTTLLRVMLAGHPQLFAANELQLLGFDTMRERSEAYSGKFGLWKEGLIRTVMELQGCDGDRAKFLIFQCEQQGRKTAEMYHLLQHWLGDKVLVDKSPSYSMDFQILQQAAQQFGDKAIFIHLVRHPYAMVESFAKMRMNQVAYLLPHSYNAREVGELTWTHSHQNIYCFLQNIPANRQYRLHFEQLVQSPERHIREMCEQIGLAFHENMVNPYQNLEAKMIDGIYADSKAMGDPKLLQQKGINPKLADSWRGVLKNDFLSATTWEVYRQFGNFL